MGVWPSYTMLHSNSSYEDKLASGSGGLLGQFSNLSAAAQNKGIPFVIQGTTANPTFLPAVGNLGNTLKALTTGQQEQNPSQGLGGILGNILNKKKKPQ